MNCPADLLPGRPAAQVYAHRGASALRPEHTLAAYAQAIADGADYIEPDLVMTADGGLIARHENEISGTTDVADHRCFAGRKTARWIDGAWCEGWFCEDFTLAELRTLRARERLPGLRSTAFDGQFPIATLEDILGLLAAHATRGGRPVGLVPEIKHSNYFRGIGLPMEEVLLRALSGSAGGTHFPVVVQSFEVGNLKALRQAIPAGLDLRLMQLFGSADTCPVDRLSDGVSYGDMSSEAGLRQVAAYADMVGVERAQVVGNDATGQPSHPTGLVPRAHAAGLQVGVYTFRPENAFLPPGLRDGADAARHAAGCVAEIRAHLQAGVDAVFCDDPALGRLAVDLPC